MMSIDLAWKVIDYWVDDGYNGDKMEFAEEVGDLDKYALRIFDCIDSNGLEYDDDIVFFAMEIDNLL